MGRPQLKQVGAFWLPDFPPGGCIPVKVLNISSTTLSPPRTLALQKINAWFFRVTGSGVPSPFGRPPEPRREVACVNNTSGTSVNREVELLVAGFLRRVAGGAFFRTLALFEGPEITEELT